MLFRLEGPRRSTLEAAGGQGFLNALEELIDAFEEDVVDLVDAEFCDDPDETSGDEVRFWTLVAIHGSATRAGVVVEAFVPVFPREESDGDDESAHGQSGFAVFVRLTLACRDEGWTVLSSQYLPAGSDPESAPPPEVGVVACPLCRSAPAAEVLFGLPDIDAEQKAVAAGMIFGGDVLDEETFGVSHGCRRCGYWWGEQTQGSAPDPDQSPDTEGPPSSRAEAARRAVERHEGRQRPPGGLSAL